MMAVLLCDESETSWGKNLRQIDFLLSTPLVAAAAFWGVFGESTREGKKERKSCYIYGRPLLFIAEQAEAWWWRIEVWPNQPAEASSSSV